MIKTNKNLVSQRRGKTLHPLKVTALLYLKEALLKENYEECAEIVEIAKELGADDAEIRYLLEDPRRSPV